MTHFEGDVPDLGPCCICGKAYAGVRSIMCLGKLAPMPGRGWGCLVCGLPQDGAVAVLCGPCLVDYQSGRGVQLLSACRGWPAVDGRIRFSELTGEFEHNLALHADEVAP